MKPDILIWNNLSQTRKNFFLKRSESDISEVMESVSNIINTVKEKGDKALLNYTLQFDGINLTEKEIRVSKKEFEEAEQQLSKEVKDSLKYAIDNIWKFHKTQKPASMNFDELRPGLFAGEKAIPIESVGLYVPRGRGSFPSMLYMLAVPAAVAGVERICVITPPGKNGQVDPGCLYAAKLCGIDEIYRIGGAQGIAALAYGTESIPSVDKITGPGSMYVSAAKRILNGIVDTGLPAGPSESMILADENADPWKLALDLLIEAEHGSDSSAILVTTSKDLAEKTSAYIEDLIADLKEPRKTFVMDVFKGYGAIFLVDNIEKGAELVNAFAPEHLQLKTREPFTTLSLIKNAGEILLGENIPFSAANYVTGVNAVLPTGGNAKTYSAVSVRDFIKYSSVVYAEKNGYEDFKDHVITLADYEGFETHGNALKLREKQ
ncbi:MAG: histidinol dehydrogenase [Spirochaetales bacterium]|nr:histidinol dehydrogenase [Spirochaetales bacterium]